MFFFSTFEPDIAYIMIQMCLYVQKMYFLRRLNPDIAYIMHRQYQLS